MKILILVPDMSMGGVTTVVKNINHGMQLNKYIVEIVCIRNDDKYVNLHANNKKDFLKALNNLRKIIREFKPDVVHSHTIFPHIVLLIYKFFFNRKLKVVCTEHGSLQEDKKNNINFILFKFLSKLANKVVFVSDFSKNTYLKNNIVKSNNCHVIYNGIESDNLTLSKKSNSEYRFCYVGRFSPEKNLLLLLNAFKEIDSKKNKKLYLIGDGDNKRELQKYCLDKNIDDVFFLGFQQDVLPLIKEMDCIVLTSFTEGLPTVILEAYSRCTLAISTNCGGVNEIIRDSKFISKDFKVESMANIMDFVMSLDELMVEKYVRKNYELVSDYFSLLNMINKYNKLYNEVVSFD